MSTNQPGDPSALPPVGTPQDQVQLPANLDPRVRAIAEAALRARSLPTDEQRAAAYHDMTAAAAAPLQAELRGQPGPLFEDDTDENTTAGFYARWYNVGFLSGVVFLGVFAIIVWLAHGFPLWLVAIVESLAVVGVVAGVVTRRGARARGRSAWFIRIWSGVLLFVGILMLAIMAVYATRP